MPTNTAPTANPPHDAPPEEPQPIAAILAVLLPGAGHVYLGHVKRGVLAGAGILGLFFGGLLIGGLDAVDRRENFVWFIGQALVGPVAFGVDWAHQNHFKVDGPVRDPSGREGIARRAARPNEIRDPRTGKAVRVRDDDGTALTFLDPATGQSRLSTMADRPPYVQSVGRANELGTLFATIAGMMNLICIIDAAFSHRRGT